MALVIEESRKAPLPMVVTASPLIWEGMRRSLMLALASGVKLVITISLLLLVLKVS